MGSEEVTADVTRTGNEAAGAPAHWLVIAEEAFLPTDSGGRVESLNLLRAAAAAGVRLHVVVPGLTVSEETAHRSALPAAGLTGIPRRTGWRSHASLAPYLFVSRPLPPDLVDRLRAVDDEDPYSAAVAISFRVAHLGTVLAEAFDLPLLVRPHNVESEYFRELARGVSFPRDLPYLFESWKLRRAEAAIHASPLVALFADIAAGDAVRRARLTTTPVVHVPPFLPPRPTAPASAARARPPGTGTVLFLGSLDNVNNQGGIRWFVKECWPRLRVTYPGADLHVVGRRAPENLRAALANAGSRVTVDAPDVCPHLAEAVVFINPVRRGAGVNIKMVEAMAAGLPVVTTTVGARGLHWRDGEHLIVTDDATAFRSAVALLLEDPDRRAQLAAAGRRFVEEELDGVRQISRLLAALVSRPARR